MKTRMIYVVEAQTGADRVKIGIAFQARPRLAQIQNSSPVPLAFAFIAECAQAANIEARVHQMLQAARIHGEWFEVSRQIAIDAITNAAAELGCDFQPLEVTKFNAGPGKKGSPRKYTNGERPFADELQAWRAELGLTRPDAAKELCVSAQTFEGWLAGRPCGQEAMTRKLMNLILQSKIRQR